MWRTHPFEPAGRGLGCETPFKSVGRALGKKGIWTRGVAGISGSLGLEDVACGPPETRWDCE